MSFFKKTFPKPSEPPNLNEIPLVILTKYSIFFLISTHYSTYLFVYFITSVVLFRWKSSTKTDTLSLCSPLLNWYK